MRTVISLARWTLLIVSVIALAGCHRLAAPANVPSSQVALKTHHARYVVAQGAEQDWSLRQSVDLGQDGCGLFTRYDLGYDALGRERIALESCYGRFVTSPRRGTTRLDRQVWQESAPGDCATFSLEPCDNGFALITCSGRYLTAGDAGSGWEPPLQWAVIMEADRVLEWEIFEIQEQR